MKSIQSELGVLSVDLGDGLLSCDEAQSIKPGDIVKVSTYAGDPLVMRFNGYFLASCEMVILGDIWGARIVSFSEPPVRHRIPQIQGSMTEILPVTVRMGSITISLGELESLGKGSIVSLGKKYSEEMDAELFIAGIPAAEGKVMVLYEDFGLQIVKAVPAESKTERVRSTGNLIDAGFTTEMCKKYDFKRPDKFTRVAINKIADIHQTLAVTLKNRNPGSVDWRCHYVDQLAFYECFSDFEKAETSYLISADRHFRRRTEPTNGRDSDAPLARLVEEKGTDQPLSEETKALFEKYNRLGAENEDQWLFICAIGDTPQESMNEHLLKLLNSSWRNIADFNFKKVDAGNELSSMKKINDNEMIVIVCITDRKEERKLGEIAGDGLYFIYPYVTLEPVLSILNV